MAVPYMMISSFPSWTGGDITAALTDALAANVPLCLEPGTYTCGPVFVPSNAYLWMHPGVTISPAVGMTSGNIFNFWSVKNATVNGGKFLIDLSVAPNVTALSGQSSNAINLSDVEVSGGYFGTNFTACTACNFDRLTVRNISAVGILFQASGSSGNKVLRCTISNVDTSHGIQFQGGAKNVASYNTISNTGNFGISIYQEQLTSASYNTIANTRVEAISIDSSYNCSASFNTASWYGSSLISQDFGMSMNGPTNPAAACNFNSFVGNFINNCAKSGIGIAGNCQFNTISNNTISSVNRINEALGAGILFYDTGCANNVAINNTLYGDSYMKYGVNDTASGITQKYANNNIVGAVTKYAKTSAAW